MKHVRYLEVDQPLDTLIQMRATERAFPAEAQQAGVNFYRGMIIGLAISLSFWALGLYLFF